ncbi:MAG: NAD(P)-dependent oxidoreductase [Elusimicrobia bacterium]|nr:NAD(P)-dependent oxidoreductase [Elusimicrobiota bacterium]
MNRFKKVLVTGGAGYVGSLLVPTLLGDGHEVVVYDSCLFGDWGLDAVKGRKGFTLVKADILDQAAYKAALAGVDAVIHLACISNDPTFALNPGLSKRVNFDAFEPLVTLSKEAGVKRFIYASTSSVYGVSDAPEVTEDHPLIPITDYNKYKGLCEPVLKRHQGPGFTVVTIRPATVCGYAPRLRLDLTVNILTACAFFKGEITVYGGAQTRPNLHVGDMVDLYRLLLSLPDETVAGGVFNAGYQNRSVADIAQVVKSVVEAKVPARKGVKVLTTPSDDPRSYHISSEKIRKALGFVPKRTIEDAVSDLVDAFAAGKVPAAMTDPRYYNIKTLQAKSAA